jgi:hypothetical protein
MDGDGFWGGRPGELEAHRFTGAGPRFYIPMSDESPADWDLI